MLSVAADLSRTEGVEKVVAATRDRFGRCDVLINNAALSFLGTFLEVPGGRWNPVIAVNLLAPVYLIEAFLPGMMERGDGPIINFSSGAADTRQGEPGGGEVQQLPYSATKAAIEALSFGLAHQLSNSGVSVNCVRPSVATEAVTFHAPHLLDDPSGRWAPPRGLRRCDGVAGRAGVRLHRKPSWLGWRQRALLRAVDGRKVGLVWKCLVIRH